MKMTNGLPTTVLQGSHGSVTRSKLTYRPELDAFRAIAVMCVVGFHFFSDRVPGGYIGVDIFFVLSGFLISSQIYIDLEAKNFHIGHFIARRIRRIFPALLVVTSFVYGAGALLLFADGFQELRKTLIQGLAFYINFSLAHSVNYFAVAVEKAPLLHLWSLSIEEQFYLFFPLLALFFWRRHFTFVLIFLIAASFVVNVLNVKAEPTATFYLPFGRIWELLAGAALARYEFAREGEKLCRSYLHDGLVVMAIGGVGFSVLYLFNATTNFPGFAGVVPVFLTCVLVFSSRRTKLVAKLMANRAVVYAGLISYPLYLVHWPILSFFRVAEPSITYNKQFRLALVIISFALAAAIYQFIEKPLKKLDVARVATSLIFVWFGFIVLLLSIEASPLQADLTPLQQKILSSSDATRQSWRYKECFLETTDQGPADFKESCKAAGRGLGQVMLIGDSHAAHLYPGLQAQLPAGSLSQYTAASCSALVGTNTANFKKCGDINLYVRGLISKTRPSTVIIGSRWDREPNELDEQLAATAKFLRDSGVQRIIAFGPPPLWEPNLKYFLVKIARVTDSIPAKLAPPKYPLYSLKASEQKTSVFFKKYNIEYVSIIDQLCSDGICQVSVGSNYPEDLITLDDDHLTKAASVFLFSKLGLQLAPQE